MWKVLVFLGLGLGVAYYLGYFPKDGKLPYVGPKRLRVTVVSASIPHLDPKGQPWHVKEPPGILGAFAELICASYGVPSGLCGKVASVIEGGRKVFPPAVEVDIWVGGDNYSTFPLASFGPQWNYTFAIDLKNQSLDTPVRVEISDAENGRTLGKPLSMSLRDFIDLQSRHLDFGNDVALQLNVERALEGPQTKDYEVKVFAKYSLKELAKRASQETLWPYGWEAVPVLNGDIVTISAEGEVCRGSCLFCEYPAQCVGPDGLDTEVNNLPEFKGTGHASLIGVYGGKTISLGSDKTFKIEQPGLLILGANIADLSYNGGYSGEYEVRVTVKSNKN